ncbi:RHS repeat-associated core domain-containing protein [Thermoflexibacter ruber]|uniref:RHS repeat-associated core domain-containing protein n=1 Tax=Thermoflexibacter ruber TaxID=1003 RepID=A0A1I2K859_9BACT|nr:RHS repeat-associated core domain-containing protein [Thermoflexibacter ruber]SFF61066.1 RHS repeat-associated core domain-containing protein [Thermoflexibacter ruber]
MIAQAGGTVQDQDKREKPVLPPNRLTLNSPVVVIPAQAQQNIGEIIIPPSPPRINLIGIGQIIGKTLSLQRKAKEDPATPYQGDLGQMNVLGRQSLSTPPQAKLVVNLYAGASIVQTYEQPVTLAGETAWEELSIGFTTTAQVRVEAYVISTEPDTEFYTWFDELKIEITDKPTAMVVQENHYYPFRLGMKGLDYVQTASKEDKWQFNSKEKQTELGLHWHDYGARNYDAQIGRFFKVDRFAEKYYNFSPYQYAANNPIRYIDVNGDSIYVQYDGHNLTYRNGQFYYASGERTGKVFLTKPKSFLSGVLTALNQLGSKTQKGKELVNFFSNKENNAYIKAGNKNSEGHGTITIKKDLTGSDIMTKEGIQESPLWLDLGHELAHTQDYLTNGEGVYDKWLDNPKDPHDPYKQSEKYATHVENIMRAQAGLPLRTHYATQGNEGYEPSLILQVERDTFDTNRPQRIIRILDTSAFFTDSQNKPINYNNFKK